MPRNLKLQKVEAAEKESTRLVAEEARMRREFSADGIDQKERKELDAIDGDIKKLKTVITTLRNEVEANKRAWEAQGRDLETVREQIRKLAEWPHPEAPGLQTQMSVIEQAVSDERWKDASDALRDLMGVIAPIYQEYELQVAAKMRCTPLRESLPVRIERARASCLDNPEILGQLDTVEANLAAAEAHCDGLDFVAAEPLFAELHTSLDAIDAAILQLLADRDAYEAAWRPVEPRLTEMSVCEFADLTPMQEEVLLIADRVRELAGAQDFAGATALIPDLLTKIQTYMDAFASRVDARTLYESRLGAVQAELANAMVSEFPALSPMQAEIGSTASEMESLAASGAYEDALLKMDALIPMLDAYRAAYDQAVLGQAFELRMEELAPRIGATAVSSYSPLTPLSTEIDTLRADAESLAASADYAGGLAKLDTCEQRLDAYDALLMAIELAKGTYDGKLPAITAECDGINQSVYGELADAQQAILTLRGQMEEAASTGDYPVALARMLDLEGQLAIIRSEREALDAARAEYETRLPSLLSRHDATKQSDFAELEERRATLEEVRTAMETAATETRYREAVQQMNELERQLNDLDARQGTLINLQNQYLALYKTLKPALASVESCTHAELESKRTPILADRDEMLEFAAQTQFDEAHSKALKLIWPLAEFALLEGLLKKYHSLLVPMTERMATVRGFTYKSLKDDIAEVEKLFAEMEKNASEAKIGEALRQMGDLEGKVTALIALNEELKKNEILYDKLSSDMAAQIEAIKKNDSEIKEIESAKKAVVKAHDEMVAKAGEDEFVLAVGKADTLNKTLIPAYLAAVNKHASEEDKFKYAQAMAKSAYDAAKKDAEAYKDHVDEGLDEIDTLYEEMNDAGEEDRFADGTAKANSLIAKIKSFNAKLGTVKQREAALAASIQKATERYKALPEEAEDKAADEYRDAGNLVDGFDALMDDKKFDDVDDDLKELDTLLTKIDDALKTQGEHEAEYDGLLRALTKRVEDAEASDFIKYLGEELTKVKDALKSMTDRGDQQDYEGGVDLAPAVETALKEFDDAEDKYEQMKVRYTERMKLLQPQLARLKRIAGELGDPGMTSLVDAFSKNWANAEKAASGNDYEKALEASEEFGTEIIKLLNACEEVKKKQEEDDGGIIDDVGDIVDDLSDAAKDFLKDKVYDRAKKYVGKKVVNAVDTAWDVYSELSDGDIVGAAKELGEGVWNAHPASDLAGLADDALDALFDEAADQIRKRL